MNDAILTAPIREKAYAKLNISLDVTARRDDGYHDMLMIMQTVSLCDSLLIEPAESGISAQTGLRYVPNDARNLAVKAAEAYLAAIGREGQGLHIRIDKRIPVGAGMAGGSADAAAVLRALNRACSSPLSAEELCRVGEQVGSDVAFCIRGGTMLASGRGEILRPLPKLPASHFVICKPDFSISTPELFRKLDAQRLRRHPDTDGLLKAIEAQDLDGLCRRLYNVFEDIDDRRMRTVRSVKGRLLDGGALGAMMTGTGSAVFGVFRDEETAKACCESLRKDIRFVTVARCVDTLLA